MVNKNINIAVVGAMAEEISAIKKEMSNINQINVHEKIFYEGEINGKTFVLTLSGVGKVSATISVSLLKSLYPIKNLIFTGIAGATNPLLNVGDIVVSDKLFQHDMDSRPNFPIYEVPYLGQAIFPADKTLAMKAVKIVNHLLQNKKFIETLNTESFNITKPKCIYGVVGSGDQFITDSRRVDEINKHLSKTYNLNLDCVEMEGAAVAQCCHELNIPFVVIRTISDKPKAMSIKNYKAFKTNVASQYSSHIIKLMLGTL